MKTFIDVEYAFPDRAKLFFITRRDILCFSRIARILGEKTSAEEQQAAVQDLVAEFRPDLRGCVVCHLDYRPEMRQYQILVYHASLPAISWDCELESERLIPESWRDQHSML